MRKRSDDYWAKRSVERLSEAEKLSIPYLKQSQKEYRATAKAVVEQVRDLYATYYRKSGNLSLIHISEPTRLQLISYAVFCL